MSSTDREVAVAALRAVAQSSQYEEVNAADRVNASALLLQLDMIPDRFRDGADEGKKSQDTDNLASASVGYLKAGTNTVVAKAANPLDAAEDVLIDCYPILSGIDEQLDRLLGSSPNAAGSAGGPESSGIANRVEDHARNVRRRLHDIFSRLQSL